MARMLLSTSGTKTCDPECGRGNGWSLKRCSKESEGTIGTCRSKWMTFPLKIGWLSDEKLTVERKLMARRWCWACCIVWMAMFRKPDSKIKQRMLSVSILESNWYISFSSHRITTTGIDRKTIEEKWYLQRRRVSQTRGI